MTTKHTPGPWISHEAPSVHGGKGFVIQSQQTYAITIATLFPGASTDRIESVARENARLIAAAPEMLEALYVIGMSAGWQYLTMETRALVEAAIAKAEGGAA